MGRKKPTNNLLILNSMGFFDVYCIDRYQENSNLSNRRAHFYIPFGVVRAVRYCAAPKPPLCKGRWAKSSILLGGVINPSVSCSDSALLHKGAFPDTHYKNRPMIVIIGRFNCFTDTGQMAQVFFLFLTCCRSGSAG